jgi:hypothetical protein
MDSSLKTESPRRTTSFDRATAAMQSVCARWLCGLAIVACGGCAGEPPPAIVPAKGVVLLNKAPLAKAQIRFIPKVGFGPEYIAVGVTDDQGRYELTCQGQPGACAVENTVTVSEADIPPELLSENKQAEMAVYLRALKNRPIPKNYATPVQTPLTVNVTIGQSEYNLELTR